MGDRCNIYGTDKFHQDRQICASRYTKDSSSCQGDSGGPLMIEAPNGQWYVVTLEKESFFHIVNEIFI